MAKKRSKRPTSPLREIQGLAEVLRGGDPEVLEKCKQHPVIQSFANQFQATPEMILMCFEAIDRKSRKESSP